MKYKLKDGFGPYVVTLGNRTYMLNSTRFREYPETILSMYQDQLQPEKQVKPKKEIIEEPEVIDGL